MSMQPSVPFTCTPVLMVQDGAQQFSIPLDRELYTLGRDPLCTITLGSAYVSRLHATLVYRCDEPWESNGQGYYELLDGDGGERRSRNGLRVNNHRVQEHILCLGDEIDLAPDVHLTFTVNPSDLNRLILDEAYCLGSQGEPDSTSAQSQARRHLWALLQQQAPRRSMSYTPGDTSTHNLPSYETLRLQTLQSPTRPVPLDQVAAKDLEESVVCIYPNSYTGEEEEEVIVLNKDAAYKLLQDDNQ
ncbi:MAG: FHA domain-containing protein [Prochlorothrix sp.]|nr:FHA domain-containing protein [Prochlorothrix sp.]